MPIYRSDFGQGGLIDFEKYPDWNPSLPYISEELKEGSMVSLRLGLPGKRPMDVTAKLEQIQPMKKLTWRGKVGKVGAS